MDWERLPTIEASRVILRWISEEEINFDFTHRRAEVGYALGRAYWGHGYIQEALHALLDYAFGVLGLHRIEADVDPRNAASIRTLERLGFQREGYLRERWQVGGEILDGVFYGLLQPDWENTKGDHEGVAGTSHP